MTKNLNTNELRVKHSPEVQALTSEIRKLKHEAEGFRETHGKLSTLIGEVMASVKVMPPVVPLAHDKASSVSSPCALCLHVTDTHYGEVQDPDEVEGLNEYSPEISKKRQFTFIEKALAWTDVMRPGYNLNEAVFLVTGDLVSGDIHDELRVTNAFPAPMQAVGAAEILATQIITVARRFPKVRVEMILDDNHGRLVRKPQAKQAGQNNWNYVIAAIVRKMLSEQKNVQFNTYDIQAAVEVRGRRYLLNHGHDVMGWAGFPYYGIERKVGKEAIKRMNGPDFRKFHRVIMGHWHAPLAHPQFWIGASASGTSTYDHKQGRHSQPGQTAWLVHPKHGEFNRTDFWL